MINIDLIRVTQGVKGTFGVMLKDGLIICTTCEDDWQDNKTNISCIPAGQYVCTPYNSAKFPGCWILKDVPGRSLILIHQGNTIHDTHGCILVGQGYGMAGALPSITNSKLALDVIRKCLPDHFTITIKEIFNGKSMPNNA